MVRNLSRGVFQYAQPPRIISYASTVGQKEGDGPFGACFDCVEPDAHFGQDTWEQAESVMQRRTVQLALDKCGLQDSDLSCICAGDLMNQCIGSTYGMRPLEIPLLGIYGACSTMAEGLLLASFLAAGGVGEYTAAVTSSHFSTAERQFRFPLSYGGQRPPTAQWTCTGSGAVILQQPDGIPDGVCVTGGCIGTMVDLGVTDANHMGAAMAPAAADTLVRYFKGTNTAPDTYDAIVTGDLGLIGSELLCDLVMKQGYDISAVHRDCGAMLGMVTAPTYNLEDYKVDYEAILNAENTPLVNRATDGLYRPGSTFKTITATAGLNEQIITGNSTYFCGHTYHFKDHDYNCTGSHGDIAVTQALRVSCNIFFYKLSEELTIDRISEYATKFGLGQSTGLETGDAAGHLSNQETFAELGADWTVGQVLQSAIGQGEWAVTPLQMANVACTIANNGTRYEPHLVDSIWDYSHTTKLEQKEPVVADQITPVNDDVFQYVENGMIAASTNNFPTRYSLSDLGFDVAVKTGTPQVSNRVQDSFFIGYAPADDPEIAFAGVIEGGEYSKYMIRSIIQAYEKTVRGEQVSVDAVGAQTTVSTDTTGTETTTSATSTTTH